MNKISAFVKEKWGISGIINDISNHGLSGAEIYKIVGQKTSFILKSYSEIYNTNHLAIVHQLMSILNQVHLAPGVIKSIDNEETVSHQGKTWELTEFISGNICKPEIIDEKSIKILAKSLSNFHDYSKIFVGSDKLKVQKVVDIGSLNADLESISQNLSSHNFISQELKDLIIKANHTCREISKKVLVNSNLGEIYKDLGVVHGDLSNKNIICKNGGFVFIDFASTKIAPIEWDISRVIIELIQAEEKLVEKFINEYNRNSNNYLLSKQSTLIWVAIMNIGLYIWTTKDYIKNHDKREYQDVVDKMNNCINTNINLMIN